MVTLTSRDCAGQAEMEGGPKRPKETNDAESLGNKLHC